MIQIPVVAALVGTISAAILSQWLWWYRQKSLINLKARETMEEIIRYKFENRLEISNVKDRLDRIEAILDTQIKFNGSHK